MANREKRSIEKVNIRFEDGSTTMITEKGEDKDIPKKFQSTSLEQAPDPKKKLE